MSSETNSCEILSFSLPQVDQQSLTKAGVLLMWDEDEDLP